MGNECCSTEKNSAKCFWICCLKKLVFLVLFFIGLYYVLPKYELMSINHRFNKVSGKVEFFPQAAPGLQAAPAQQAPSAQ